MSDEFIIIAPLLGAVASAVLTLLVDAFGSRRAAIFVGVLGLWVTAALAVASVVTVREPAAAYGVFVGGAGFSVTPLIVAAFTALAVLGGASALSRQQGGGAALALIALASAGAMALSQSLDLVVTIISLETIAVSGYGLVSGAKTARSDEAAMKYVIQGAVATGLIVLGTAVLVGLYGGGTTYAGISQSLGSGFLGPATAAAALVLAAFAYKLGAAPFHWWAPDAFETAPPSAGAFMATAPKVGAIAGLVVVISVVFGSGIPKIPYQIAVVAVLSIVIGNFAGLRQSSYTRMLGYSGIAQIGYALVGVVIGASAQAGFALSMMPYILVLVTAYGLGALGAFLGADAVRAARPKWDGTIAGLAGFGKEHPFVAAAMSVCMFSLTGIPLTAGFWGKLMVFGSAITTTYAWLAWVGIVASVVSFGYYGSVIRAMFFDDSVAEDLEPAADDEGSATASRDSASVVLVIVALAILAAGIVPLVTGLDSILLVFAG